MRASAYQFAQEIDRQIQALSSSDYLMKRGGAKRLLEELYPIARLGIHLKLPGVEVEVEAFQDSGSADGRIYRSGAYDEEFDVQVTHVGSYEDALRRELLVAEGAAPGAGQIYRDKKTGNVVAEFGSEDRGQPTLDLAAAILGLFKKKMAIAYGKNTTLIVAFEEITLQGRSAWQALWNEISKGGGLSSEYFRSVYLLNCATNELQRVA